MRYMEAECIRNKHTHSQAHIQSSKMLSCLSIQNWENSEFWLFIKVSCDLENESKSPQQKTVIRSTDLEESFHFGRTEAEALLDTRVSLEE